jgi:DNA-binding GntR family transcriptional regulator
MGPIGPVLDALPELLTFAIANSKLLAVTEGLPELNGETLASQAYAALRSAIMSGELPRGSKITERGLAERMGVSPTPVREAMRRLEQDRLIVRTGLRSVRVADLPADTLAEISLIESHLRSLAARLAARNASDAEITRMQSLLDQADRERARIQGLPSSERAAQEAGATQILTLLRQFHHAVDQACHNKVLLSFLETVEAFKPADRQAVLREQIAEGDSDPDERFADHRAMLEAIQNRDEDAAEWLTLSHTTSASAALLARRPIEA